MPKRSFSQLLEDHDASLISQVSGSLIDSAPSLARVFYSTLLLDAHARVHLDPEAIETKMHGMFERWALSVLADAESMNPADLDQSHAQVGDVHARVGIPEEQVLYGIQVVKNHCFDKYLDQNSETPVADLKQGIRYINDLFDTCLAVMNRSYIQRTVEDERNDQAFKMRIAETELLVECERMKTDLVAWTRDVFFKIDGTPHDVDLDVHGSIFGTWLLHKAPIYFGESVELESIRAATTSLAETTTQLSSAVRSHEASQKDDLLERLRKLTGEICWNIDRLSERSQRELDNRDRLTQLYGRRYLDSVLKRENLFALNSHETYSALLINIDELKQVNDAFGYQAGDSAIRDTASTLLATTRQTDFCFRYGGDEFIVVMPSTSELEASRRGEAIRRAIEETDCISPDGASFRVTVSIGCTEFRGHPDYEVLLKEVDEALYCAKADGGNCLIRTSQGISQD